MNWLMWTLLVLAIMAVFVAWDVIFCGGRGCRSLADRLPLPLRSGDVGSEEIESRSRRKPPANDQQPK